MHESNELSLEYLSYPMLSEVIPAITLKKDTLGIPATISR